MNNTKTLQKSFQIGKKLKKALICDVEVIMQLNTEKQNNGNNLLDACNYSYIFSARK